MKFVQYLVTICKVKARADFERNRCLTVKCRAVCIDLLYFGEGTRICFVVDLEYLVRILISTRVKANLTLCLDSNNKSENHLYFRKERFTKD